MKKIIKALLCATVAVTSAAAFGSCTKEIDYYDYVSEARESVYIYEDDDISVKIYSGRRESPYNADGICGEISPFTEIYVELAAQSEKVSVSAAGISGEMTYLTVKGCYYLSAGVGITPAESVPLTVTAGENTKEYTATSVLYSGIIDSRGALECVRQYKSGLFESLTENDFFAGEIHIRLLYDEACYYFVGIYDREGNLTACLADGATGKIIAERSLEN